MDEINMFKGHEAILQDEIVLGELPTEILSTIRSGSSPRYLDAIAAAGAIPRLTTRVFARFENIFADTCSRWVERKQGKEQDPAIIEAFARILPFAPYLHVYLANYTTSQSNITSGREIRYLSDESSSNISDLSETGLQSLLLAGFRLLRFDKSLYTSLISASKIQNLLRHDNQAVRYLAARILALLLSASDAKLEELLAAHVGKNSPVMGDYDGENIDYGFLSLYEAQRIKDVAAMRLAMKDSASGSQQLQPQGLSPLVVRCGQVLLPRPNGMPSRGSSLITTITTANNKEEFAQALLSSSPLLIHGLSGAGKTSLVNDFARELGKESTMVTLHLNEQTDAKMLIGMYATDTTPGSFTWRAGVLTTAIREGRWVFIEDLDRAPNEVISVILPLIERGELLIPSRGETIRAAPGFRLIASIRTSLNMNGHENPPAMHMLGARLWNRVPVKMPSRQEFQEIINGTYPVLHKFLPGIISVYERLYSLAQNPSFALKSKTSLGRPISPRDLLKWCRRLEATLLAAGSKTGEEPITEGTKDEMFMEAADCFASSLQTEDARKTVIVAIAEEMHIPPQRAAHYLDNHVPRLNDTETHLQVGRVTIPKRRTLNRVSKLSKKTRPFANTTHAKRLLEQVGVALKMAEPVLLVGETGIGKTTVIQQLADSLGYKLTAVNLSQQSEVGDLLGGFKPVNVRSLAIPLKEEFDDLFAATGISASRNQKYLESIGKCVAKGHWTKASKLWREAPKMFDRIVSDLEKLDAAKARDGPEAPVKRRKTESKLQSLLTLKPRWDLFSKSLEQFDVQLSGGSKGFAFTFVEGNIVKAARNGEWVLLDEINLASPDTLESIADLLLSGSGTKPSILLSETGEIERVQAHPNFRIFGAMNPATDVGKRDLPMGLRSRFTEIYVDSPDKNLDDLLAVIKVYLKSSSTNDERAAHDIARLYMNTKRMADEKQLVDGASQVPHFSLRTLTRVLSYVTEIAPSYGLRRALYEGFAMGFLTLLNRESEKILVPLISHHLLDSHGNPQALLAQTPRHPEDGRQYVRFMNNKRDRQYWMLQGREAPQEQPHYIITPFVERNMLNLVRATSTRRFPVLVQGPTSAGKTSMIEYLAKFSGNKFVRINNHEHTDLQEYLGTYVSGTDGQLKFQEGLLVQALREGHWIVLDELNLAPTDVLEALNRLLDDNRELLIPETQEIVRPHENFMLFATQNPPGLYGGRKTLSRAFRNRFLELHFDDIPEDELEYILENRSKNTAPSDCKRIVTVYKELSRLRQSSRLFEQKDSFATLRDLFRWALRDADNREQLAANGYMLLGERVRKAEERQAVKEIIEKVMKVKIDPSVLYSAEASPEIQLHNETSNAQGVVWTGAMRRLYVLVSHAMRNNEPVLLVGETGCGKTTVCQMLAEAFSKELHIVNAHQNTETGDLIGAQRPVRNRAAVLKQLEDDLKVALNGLNIQTDAPLEDVEQLTAAYNALSEEQRSSVPEDLRQRIYNGQSKAKALFEWSDGSLVQAMRDGEFFLLDEISLADDSVLERLNSVLEPQRTILLAEKGITDSFVQATEGFQFFATMNPGGDYGKRELSPALRNRFTEIWVPSLSEMEDVLQIVDSKLKAPTKKFAKPMVDFAEWFGKKYRSSSTQSISVRDLLAWISFVNGSKPQDPYFAILHGAAMVYIDTLGANPAALLAINPESIIEERATCLQQLSSFLNHNVSAIYYTNVEVNNKEDGFVAFGDFQIPKAAASQADTGFAFDAPTTKLNAMRVVRALQVQKPILIEGSPGVGKTTLIAALAKAIGKPLTRINLSEQTDLMDLFGSDVPVEGAEAGNFAWRDAAFLQAMQRGDWVLLDEMNLASQSVLEGLNACLDHRGEVYISELDQTFKRHPNFSVFAAQNPHHQGGGRKGLPSSFVNRFTVVYADVFRNDDLTLICQHNFPNMDKAVMANIIGFVSALEQEVVYQRKFGSEGGPWEFNLRDTLRWLQLLASNDPLTGAACPADFLNLIFRQRFRNTKDRDHVGRIFSQVFGYEVPFRHLFPNLASDAYQVGMAYLPRNQLIQRFPFPHEDVRKHYAEIESIMTCLRQNMPCILVGPSGSGKSSLVQHVAAAAGAELVVFPLNSDIDTMDLVGGFEQLDPQRSSAAFLQNLSAFLEGKVLSSIPRAVPDEAIEILSMCKSLDQVSANYFAKILQVLVSLYEKTSLPELEGFLATCQHFVDNPNKIESARFEWVDGVLVKALEEGKWLVLDNANLCSSSVLDRLNSLLEPSGYLSINEHCGPDGEPKLVRPHPNFRLFMTMDARFGELSRAMRNRSIEIFLDTPIVSTDSENQSILSPVLEPSQQRLGNLIKALEAEGPSGQLGSLTKVALDHVSTADMELLPRFSQAIQNGLINPLFINEETGKTIAQYLEALQPGKSQGLAHDVNLMYDGLAGALGLPESFKESQTIHTLTNSPLVPLLQKYPATANQSYWLGTVLELQVEALDGHEAQQEQLRTLSTLKPSQMNRLQRSMVRDRVSAVAKDSTATIAEFLRESLQTFHEFLQNAPPSDSAIYSRVLREIMQFWWQTYRLAQTGNFEEATFQAHLAIGTDLLERLAKVHPGGIVEWFQKRLKQNFDSGFSLTTGLSMETLWLQFRPLPVSSTERLQMLIEMEALAAKFDALRWKISISVSELAGIMSALVKAHHTLLTADVDGRSLIKTLSSELERLEAVAGKETASVTPFLASQFEALRQYKALQAMHTKTFSEGGDLGATDPETIVLANHSTASVMHLASASPSSCALFGTDYLWGSGDGLQPINDSFSASLIHKLHNSSDVTLNSLRLLETELPLMGRQLIQASASLSRNHFLDMDLFLVELMVDIVGAHNAELAAAFRVAAGELDSLPIPSAYSMATSAVLHPQSFKSVYESDTCPPQLQHVIKEHFMPALVSITAAKKHTGNQAKHSALAWIQFAVGVLALYVPDRSYDPDKRQRLERERHIEMSQALQTRFGALQKFETILTSQSSNLRSQLLEAEIKELGEPTETLQEVFRPTVSELDQLQGEFNNLLNSVLSARPHALLFNQLTSGSDDSIQSLKLLQSNVVQIVRRFTDRFRAYGDMTVPLVSMLRCLQIGLFMAGMSAEEPSNNSRNIMALSKITPFLGGEADFDDSNSLEQPLEVLGQVAVITSVNGIDSFGDDQRQIIYNIFHSCFEQWSKRLDLDREEAETKGGLYRFKGSFEDENEEDQEQFNELFPAFDEEESKPIGGTIHHAARDTAIILSKLHAEIYLNKSVPADKIQSLIRTVASRIGTIWNADTSLHGSGEDSSRSLTESLLPGALVLLDDKIQALNADNTASDTYNFYLDANLPEARKLVGLIHQIQVRFRELQDIDEIGHMQPLDDVLVSCRELLEFHHTEPIAKIITKVEKVHTYMHEWQFGGWASRVNSATALYDRLTQTIVSWRRLELSTWAKLFEMENEKCDDDAKSWWFIAYQVVVAAPLELSGSEEELRTYAQKLLKDLETYFATAIQGQYAQRLQMIKQLQQHLKMLAIDYPLMTIIENAVSSFIELYTRYEGPVSENLRKGRVTLEKAMKDVLLLASWKDTNIVALRDSAKRSHHKLFKLVRKYRALLSQPMEQVLKQGLPEEQEGTVGNVVVANHKALVTVDKSALALCEAQVPQWAKKSPRYINISKTVGMMDDASQIPEDTLNVSEYIDSFLGNIITTAAQLQKATPSVLTEDNKVTVKHLKTRKRKLFAETLKELREMGIRHNLGTAGLAQQDSLSVVLANTDNLPQSETFDFSGINYYYSQTLDLVPRARLATRGHNEDLSLAEVARSSGLLEGLLQVVLQQRNALAQAVSDSAALGESIKQATGLWSGGEYDISCVVSSPTYEPALKWLPSILRVALGLLKTHNRLGNEANADVEDVLVLWIEKFDIFRQKYNRLPALPSGIQSSSHIDVETEVHDAIKGLRVNVEFLKTSHPHLDYILHQILPWTATESVITEANGSGADIKALDKNISKICDSILVAVEKLSKSISTMPTSTDDPLWLTNNDISLRNNFAFLYSTEINQQVNEAFTLLRSLDLSNPQVSRVAGAMFAVALPIVQQYFNILQQSIARYAQLNRATCKMTYILAKTFIQIATQGFCTPAEKSDSQEGKTDKLESGTGLGEGEGADDISKDIQEDEDLTELAEEPNKGDKEDDIEDEKDAVDMADADMEGEMGEAEEKGEDNEGSGDEEDKDDIEEETGDVDDLDPNAVDEKMWDGDGEKADKDQEGDDSKGEQNKDEQVAATENDKPAPENKEGEGEEEEEEVGAEQGEEVTQQDDVEKHDPHADDGEALDLPDDMDLDGEDEEGNEMNNEDDGMEDLSDVEGEEQEGDEVDESDDKNKDGEDVDGQEDQDMGEELDVIDLDEKDEEGEGDDTNEAGEKAEGEDAEEEPETQENLLREHDDDAKADDENLIPSEAQGVGEDQEDNNNADDNKESSSKAQREDGGGGGDASEQKDAAAEEGESGRQAQGEAPTSNDETQDAADAQPFKKLGDALENWHRQQTKIRDAPQSQEKGQDQPMDNENETPEFQHLQDEEAEEDTTQALGTATEDQAHAVDESMAIDTETKEMPEAFQPDEVEQDDVEHDDVMDLEDNEDAQPESTDAYEGRAGAAIHQAKEDRDPERHVPQQQTDIEDDVEEVDRELDATHIDDSGAVELSRDSASARQLWTDYEASTRDLSLSLTEQLRLILAPTLATKMRGDFRTGKRLNIKRIIPYIASSFKRDKIWMRRSVPSKRSYQIMLAVDDSKSMGESGSGALAFETLAMVSKSLSMLEVGEICVLGFGENVKVAHDFDTPFSADAGPRVFQNFGFEQPRTDVTKLVRESIELFRAARAKASNTPADLWQLELIVSDGVCDSSEHEPIRRLLREAIEERIMIVFIIVDDVRNKKKGESVMDLKEAKFVKDEYTGTSNVKIERYLDTFPFQYYLVVGDVKELPGVLATLLRQWFAEVADSSG
ncbi:hypothetical protein V494_06163 [Pseudogymnoascus sp. VKM F-4513 (FW-928)]|nr:hypothetical protein V494_06163 [Pseudogymnoascus sp. VKM F-4513 (FW-928)]